METQRGKILEFKGLNNAVAEESLGRIPIFFPLRFACAFVVGESMESMETRIHGIHGNGNSSNFEGFGLRINYWVVEFKPSHLAVLVDYM